MHGYARRAFIIPDLREESWLIFPNRQYAFAPARDGVRVLLSADRGALSHHNHPEARVQDMDNGHNGTDDQKSSVATHSTAKGNKGKAFPISAHNSANFFPERSSHNHAFRALWIIHIFIISLIKLYFQITPRSLVFFIFEIVIHFALSAQTVRPEVLSQCLIITIERNPHDQYR